MTFGKKVFNFYKTLQFPQIHAHNISVLAPFKNVEVLKINKNFYSKYYNDNSSRYFIIGINPGRFGAGVTGIPFTDPVNLENVLELQNPFTKKHELSSVFIYHIIKSLGGPDSFFSAFYFTAVSPVGFVRRGKNVNYYDHPFLVSGIWEEFYRSCLLKQVSFGAETNTAFILGRGKNSAYFDYLNNKAGIFKRIVVLPHPRWVMQYNYRKMDEYIGNYKTILSPFLR